MIPPCAAPRFRWRPQFLIGLSYVPIGKVPHPFTPCSCYTNQRLKAELGKSFGLGASRPRPIDHLYRAQEHGRQSGSATYQAEHIGLGEQQYEGRSYYGWRLRPTTEAVADPIYAPSCLVSLPTMRAFTAWRGMISPESRA
jgi:hypothetical protein